MFGVLIAKDPNGNIGFLAAFSGILCGSNYHPYFVPPIYDLQKPDGYFPKEEKNISEINKRITLLETSGALQQKEEEYKSALLRERSTLQAKRQYIKELKLRRDNLRVKATLSEEEKASLIKESQHQKAELKRLRDSLKEASEKAREQLQELTNEIERLKKMNELIEKQLEFRIEMLSKQYKEEIDKAKRMEILKEIDSLTKQLKRKNLGDFYE